VTAARNRAAQHGKPARAAGEEAAGRRHPAPEPAGAAGAAAGDAGAAAAIAGAAGTERQRPASLAIRSLERRRWSGDLLSPVTAGLVVHGSGGIGKSVLAGQIAARAARAEPERVIAVLSGEVSADRVLAALAGALRRHPLAPAWSGIRAEAVEAADQIGLPWDHRFGLLREHLLGQVPALIVLDDFDDNLAADDHGWAVGDPALAGLLASWVREPSLARLLITCRHPFSLPEGPGQALAFRRLGPLSRSGAAGMAGALPALHLLGEEQLDRTWRLVGGHPRAMEYLDVLLGAGHARLTDLTRLLAAEIQARTGRPVAAAGPDAPTGLPPEAAATIALVAGEVLLGELCRHLSAGALSLLTGVSVYRAPIGCHPLLLPPGQHDGPAELAGLIAECEATGLMTAAPGSEPAQPMTAARGPGPAGPVTAAPGSEPARPKTAPRGSELPELFVHRWTACELHRWLTAQQRGGEVADAHRRAVAYWRRRVTLSPQDGHALAEAGHHLLQSGDGIRGVRSPAGPAASARVPRRALGLGALVTSLAIAVAAASAAVLAPGAGPAAKPTASQAAAAVASYSAALRRRAAAWAAQQVSRDAIVACDPAMCSALQANGMPTPDLLVLRPAAPDPLGSDVVIATAVVRSQFGGHLASVYAPAVLASFGSGGTRIDVRAVAPDGSAAYRAALAADLAARRRAATQLLHNPQLAATPAAQRDLLAGRVDARLLITVAAVAAEWPVRVIAFGDAGPGASPGVPLRAAEVQTALPEVLRRILGFLRAQRPPFLVARAGIARSGGRPVLTIEFAAPSPVGLLQTQPAGGRAPAPWHRYAHMTGRGAGHPRTGMENQ
jgi:hypothetical protein